MISVLGIPVDPVPKTCITNSPSFCNLYEKKNMRANEADSLNEDFCMHRDKSKPDNGEWTGVNREHPRGSNSIHELFGKLHLEVSKGPSWAMEKII